MTRRKTRPTIPAQPVPADHSWVGIGRGRFEAFIAECLAQDNLGLVKAEVERFRQGLEELQFPASPDEVPFRRDILLAELDQILGARTLERARYYVRRLKASAEGVRSGSINDINLRRWKEYDEVLTDSLWLFERRDASGEHEGWYWGNFVPQIPHQLLLRYTKRGEWVLDPFAGSGTTLIECRRLGRNGLGVELNPDVVARARELVAAEPNPHGVLTEIVEGDSTALDVAGLLRERGIAAVQFVIMHPPYYDIIRFSDHARDLSRARSVEGFLEMFGQAVEGGAAALDEGRYLAVVIGDKYARQEWIPLGFYTMQEVRRRGFTLKSIIVKNYEETRAKRQKQGLWRYRALAGGFYLFKHEYILLFQKKRKRE